MYLNTVRLAIRDAQAEQAIHGTKSRHPCLGLPESPLPRPLYELATHCQLLALLKLSGVIAPHILTRFTFLVTLMPCG